MAMDFYPKAAKRDEKPTGKDKTPGDVPSHRIPIHDHAGNVRGHVGRTATQATVARFLGRHGAELTSKDGRDVWIGKKPPPPPPPPPLPGMPPMEEARGEAEIGLIQARTEALRGKVGSGKPKPGSKPPKGRPK